MFVRMQAALERQMKSVDRWSVWLFPRRSAFRNAARRHNWDKTKIKQQ